MADPKLKLFLDAFHERITAMGFVWIASRRYHAQIARHTSGWIGLNVAHRASILEINQVVGIVDQRIEKLMDSLEHYRTGLPNTWMTSIGYLLPAQRYDPLLMGEVSDIEPELDRLMGMLNEYALPTMRRLSDIAELSRQLEPMNSIPANLRCWYSPAAAYLARDYDTAAARLDRELSILAGSDGREAEEYRRFAEKLRARMQR